MPTALMFASASNTVLRLTDTLRVTLTFDGYVRESGMPAVSEAKPASMKA